MNLWYSEGTLERSGPSASFVEWAWMSEKWRQILKLLKPRSFDACKNAAVPIIVMLGHSKVDIEVSDADMETMKSNDCRGVLENDGDTNSILAIT